MIQVTTEARAMEKYSLKHQLFELQNVIVEEKAMNTEQNAYFSRIIIDDLGVTKVHVVTSQYHFKRAKDIFAKASPAASSGADPGFSKEGGGDKRAPTLSNRYCCLASPFFTRKRMFKIFAFVLP